MGAGGSGETARYEQLHLPYSHAKQNKKEKGHHIYCIRIDYVSYYGFALEATAEFLTKRSSF